MTQRLTRRIVVAAAAAIFSITAPVASLRGSSAEAFVVAPGPALRLRAHDISARPAVTALPASTEGAESIAPPQRAPTFNGKVIFPMKALEVGLKGHKVAAVYAVMNSEYKRG